MRSHRFLAWSLLGVLALGLQATPPVPANDGVKMGRAAAVLALMTVEKDLLETAATARIERGALRWTFRGHEVVWPLVGARKGGAELSVNDYRMPLPRDLFVRLLTQTFQVNPVPDRRLRSLLYARFLGDVGQDLDERVYRPIVHALWGDILKDKEEGRRSFYGVSVLAADEAVANEMAASEEAIAAYHKCVQGCLDMSNDKDVRMACIHGCANLLLKK